MKFWIQFFSQFFSLTIVEDTGIDAGAVDGADDQAVETQTDAEPASVADAVLDEMGLSDGEGDAKVATESETSTDIENAGEEKPADDAEAAAAKEAAEAEAAKAKATITDDDLKPLETKSQATNERFQKITEGYKAEKSRADEAENKVQQYEASFNALRELGFQDETAGHDLVEFAGYRHTLASGDVEAFTQILGNQIKQFEAMHGKKVTISASALHDFPDLQEKVDNLELDEATALEVARARSVQERANRQQRDQVKVQKTAEAHQRELEEATASVTALQDQWKKTDPDFPAILPYLQPHLAEIGSSFQPNQWAKALELQYKSLKKALAEQGNSRSQPSPLRGNGHQQGRPAPTSPAEAALQELGLA
jgi:hypothetical protein